MSGGPEKPNALEQFADALKQFDNFQKAEEDAGNSFVLMSAKEAIKIAGCTMPPGDYELPGGGKLVLL